MSIKDTLTDNSMESFTFEGKTYNRRVDNGAVVYDIESAAGGGSGASFSTGWVNTDGTTTVANGATLNFTHNLGTTDLICNVYAAKDSSGTGAINISSPSGATFSTQAHFGTLTSITSNLIQVILCTDGLLHPNTGSIALVSDAVNSNFGTDSSTGAGDPYPYIKVVVLSLAQATETPSPNQPSSFVRTNYGQLTRFTHGVNRNNDNYHWFAGNPITLGSTFEEINGYMKFSLQYVAHDYGESSFYQSITNHGDVAAADKPSGAIYVNGNNVGTATTINPSVEYTVNDIVLGQGSGEGSENFTRYIKGANFQTVYSPSIDIPQTTYRTYTIPSNESWDDTPPDDDYVARWGMVAIKILEIGFNNL